MGRTAGQFCSRESMFRIPTESMPPELTPLIQVAEPSDRNAMTWQQQKDFAPAVKANARESKGKAVHWEQLDLQAIEDPPATATIGTDDSWSVQQAELPIVSPRRQSRGKAAASPLRNSSTPASTDTTILNSTSQDSTTQEPRKARGRRQKKPNSNTQINMSGPTASIPPHLRRKAAAAAAALTVAQSKAESSATNGSTATSDKSKTGQGIKLHSSPNGAGQVLTPPPSLPTTPRELEFEKAPAPQTVTKNAQNFGQIEDGGWTASWDTPKPEPTPVAPKKGNPRWPRIGGAPRKTVWPKNSEMRALPSESSSDGGVKCRSNSDGDPDYDVKKLMDWNGDWLPPPEQWSARKGHTSRHFGQGIEVWINDHGDECDKEITYDATTFSDDLCKELVPRYWLHTMVEQKPLGEFWKCMPSQTPYALSDVDMSEYPPFWERYEDESSCFIDGHEVPDARVDPGDIENHDPHGDLLASADVRVKAILEVREGKRRRTLMKQRRPPKEFKPAMPAMEDRRIQPKSNVYFRPVQPTDVEGIAAIYNHYVDHTIYANEFEGRSTSQISSRIDEVISNGLPYLVAIARGNQPRGPKGYVSEKIVGYINLDDHCDQSSMFRFTFELELYVHPGYLSQNIASCLLDRLLEMANTGYNACGGYEYRNDSQYLKTGPSRVIKTILLPVLKEQGEDIEKTSAFLKKFNFHLAGHVKQMGFKLGKVVDAYTYRHTTTEAIDPNSRPTVSLERD